MDVKFFSKPVTFMIQTAALLCKSSGIDVVGDNVVYKTILC
jgi:hypothetical protein